MAERTRIGIDLDNTLIDYDRVFRAFALEQGLLSPELAINKAHVREALRAMPDGEIAWQRLQGAVYGKGVRQAVLFDGADGFLRRARERGCEVFIVSHKTEFGHYDPDRVNLRAAAREWMELQGFFREDGFAIPNGNAVFSATRSEKIATIRELGVSLFIDDLPEVLEDRAFPAAATGILFTGGGGTLGAYPRAFAHWRDITEMVFGVKPTVAAPEQIADEASGLVGWRVLSAVPVRRGGNNRVFVLIGRDTRAVLKIYPTQDEDPRDRLGHEFGALSFLARCGVSEVPRPIACDPDGHRAVYEWIDGVPPGKVGTAEVDELADFFSRLQQLRWCDGADALPEGATPALSPASVAGQLAQRVARLTAVIAPGTEIAEFVAARLEPAIARAVDHLHRDCAAADLDFDAPLAPWLRVLSPSDFGFHNALRRPNGKLAFLDFEYFGWDEPAKAVADVMLHAGMSLSDALARRYRERVSDVLRQTDPGFPKRFALFFPAMRAIWCLILLNEFLPERWARRVLAGVADDRATAEARQLAKARRMLTRGFD